MDSRVVRMSDIGEGEVQWLWAGMIPLGKVTVLSGDPGMGKSFVALDLVDVTVAACAPALRHGDFPARWAPSAKALAR